MRQFKKPNPFLQGFIKFGNYLWCFFQMQIYWILFTLLGLGLLGIFPATVSVLSIIYESFQTKELNTNVFSVFKENYQTYFKQSNIIGYIGLAILLFFYIDLRISAVFIQSIFIHSFLLFLSLVFLIVFQYTGTVMVRYHFGIKNIFKQSFFVGLASPLNSIASLVGILVLGWVLWKIPFLAAFFGIPLILLPVVWFTRAGILAAEAAKRDQ